MTKRTERINSLKIIFILNIINSAIFLWTSYIVLANWHDSSLTKIIFLLMVHVSWTLLIALFNIHTFILLHSKLNKRERSAIILSPLLSLFGCGVFVIYNAWKKSGLSSEQRDEAIQRIEISKVNTTIIEKNILDELKPAIKDKINILLQIGAENLESQENVNAFILDILKEQGITLEFDVKDEEILQVGYNL